MREAEAAAPPPKRLRLSIKRHRSSLPPSIPKDPANILATSVIDHLSVDHQGGSSWLRARSTGLLLLLGLREEHQ
jgi:hypothetical protein